MPLCTDSSNIQRPCRFLICTKIAVNDVSHSDIILALLASQTYTLKALHYVECWFDCSLRCAATLCDIFVSSYVIK